jgi:hypothetical protein
MRYVEEIGRKEVKERESGEKCSQWGSEKIGFCN